MKRTICFSFVCIMCHVSRMYVHTCACVCVRESDHMINDGMKTNGHAYTRIYAHTQN